MEMPQKSKILTFAVKSLSEHGRKEVLKIDCGAAGRVVASDIRDQRFKPLPSFLT